MMVMAPEIHVKKLDCFVIGLEFYIFVTVRVGISGTFLMGGFHPGEKAPRKWKYYHLRAG